MTQLHPGVEQELLSRSPERRPESRLRTTR